MMMQMIILLCKQEGSWRLNLNNDNSYCKFIELGKMGSKKKKWGEFKFMLIQKP